MKKLKTVKETFHRSSKERGITLVALVITIVILIILAVVAINAVFGDDGLIEKSKLAKDLFESSSENEAKGINSLYDEMAGYLENPTLSITETHTNSSITINAETDSTRVTTYEFYIDGKLQVSQSETSYTMSVSLENKEPYVPSGFTHTEGTVDTGYVIQDDKIGNEFVWVPIKGKAYTAKVVAKNESGRIVASSDEITIAISELSRTVNGSEIEYTEWEEEEGDVKDKKSVAYFKQSVAKNCGFYIGRYEMGMPGQKSGDDPVLDFTNEARNISGVPVCVARVMPWTNIDWSTAKSNLESMYNGEVQSAMMNSYAKRSTLNWILDTGAKTLDELEYPSDWGNYEWGEGFGENLFKGNTYTIYNLGEER